MLVHGGAGGHAVKLLKELSILLHHLEEGGGGREGRREEEIDGMIRKRGGREGRRDEGVEGGRGGGKG